MAEQSAIKCQWCIERQVEVINDAVGLYLNIPICDECLGPILENKENVPAALIDVSINSELEPRKKAALELLDQFEAVFDNFPMTAEEVLNDRDLFYNHRAPALINCSTDEIKKIINRRKAVLFAIRIKDEQWSTVIEQLKNEERIAKGLTGVAKSIKEKAKKPSGYADDKAKKLAKMLGITVAQLEAMGADARTTEFAGIVGQDASNKAIAQEEKQVEAKEIDKPQTAKQALTAIQDKLAGKTAKPRVNPITGKPYS